MEIENLFRNIVCTLRKFTNSINRNDTTQTNDIIANLNDILHSLNYLQRDNNCAEIKNLEKHLIQEMHKLLKNLSIKTNKSTIYATKLQKNIDYLKWMNKQRSINTGSRKYTVGQREIFYAYLGDNIGSEQNGRRPVIILQNDTGNINGNTTIIAPVTTHQKKVKYDKQVKKFYIEINHNDVIKKKYLDFYEVPLKLEGKEKGLYGFVNIMHMREIDRKRIDSQCLGKATKKCFDDIIQAINKNLS